MSDSLTNKGLAVTGAASDTGSQAIVVVGTARGGTSMVAGSMQHMGIFMGDRAAAPVFEDVRLSGFFEQKDSAGAAAVAAEYSRKHAQWGWKRPWAIDHLEEVHRVLGAPRYVFIYKDVMSIAQRNAISMLTDLLPGMERALEQYAKTLVFLRSRPTHAMLVSYEKAMADPAHFLGELAGFCQVSPSEHQLLAARSFIQPNPEQYLDASRITKAQGRLGGVANGKMIYGWARFLHSKAPAAVDLFVNDRKLASVVANKPRPDLQERFNQACAFNYVYPEGAVRQGDVLRARVVNEVRDLDNSPWQYP